MTTEGGGVMMTDESERLSAGTKVFVRLYVHPEYCLHLSVHLYDCPSVGLCRSIVSVCPSVHPSVCLAIKLSVCLS